MLKLVARVLLRTAGWRAEGGRPVPDRYVLIAAPHTSNWDFVWLLAFAAYYEVRMQFLMKHTLFRGPFGWALRKLGGVPVRRERRGNLVDAMAQVFDDPRPLALVIPAEGTRGYAPHWKSGFYHIARQAQVPIVMSFLDYSRKVGGFGPAFEPKGDVRADMDEIRAFYADKKGKYPELQGDIRLKEEM